MTVYLVMQTPWDKKAEIGGVFTTAEAAHAAIDQRDPAHSSYAVTVIPVDQLFPEDGGVWAESYWYNPGRGREEIPQEVWDSLAEASAKS